jgi:hypothetical protein
VDLLPPTKDLMNNYPHPPVVGCQERLEKVENCLSGIYRDNHIKQKKKDMIRILFQNLQGSI